MPIFSLVRTAWSVARRTSNHNTILQRCLMKKSEINNQTDQKSWAYDHAITVKKRTRQSQMTAVDALVVANEAYAGKFPPKHAQMKMQPTKKLCLVVCMDSRIDSFAAFGLQIGEAHIIRNAGGRMAEAIRSLIVSQTLLGTEEVALIHHTECGILAFSDAQIKEKVREQRGVSADHMEFLTFPGDPYKSVLEDMRYYKQSPLVKHHLPIRGFVYDIKNGKLNEVFDNNDGATSTAR